MATDGQLSIGAIRVWQALRDAAAHAPARALTDAQLAELTHLPQREIIDAAGELLSAGVLVLAGPSGRWLGTPRQARDYSRALKRRALRIFIRRRDVVRAMLTARRRQPIDDLGQLYLALRP
jgi:hypothetical protein